MRFSLISLALVLFTLAGEHVAIVDARRTPTSADWWFVFGLIEDAIHGSTCEKTNGHWDYPPTYGDALNSRGEDDCEWFPEKRNPKPLGSRLVRMAFHDAMGESDGFVNITDPEHNGLQSAIHVIDKLYDENSITDFLTKADFYAWSYMTALLVACQLQTGGMNEDFDDYLPNIPVRFGRADLDDPDVWFPNELIPFGGPNGRHDDVMQYFLQKFGFTEYETAIVLGGGHTLGGARKTESGYAGMWTQGKNDFDLQYFENLANPIPLDCSVSKTSDEINGIVGCAKLEELGLCEQYENGTAHGNRCMGWEQVRMPTTDEHGHTTFKFQWRHSCDENRNGCTHIMMNVDMVLLRRIDEYYIDEKTGQVAFPDDYVKPDGAPDVCGTEDPRSGHKRLFASCFPVRDLVDSSSVILYYNLINDGSAEFFSKRNEFIDKFGVLYDKIISTVPTGQDSLAVLPITPREPTPTINKGDPCPINEFWCTYSEVGPNPFPCSHCRTGYCALEQDGSAVCKEEDYVVDQWDNGTPCDPNPEDPDICTIPAELQGLGQEYYACPKCKSGWCKTNRFGNAATCRPPSSRLLRG